MFLLGVKSKRSVFTLIGAVLLGYASLIKLTAVLVVPGTLTLAWILTPRQNTRELVNSILVFLGIAALIQLPWEISQWRATGSLFPVWAGKPAAELVKANQFVYYLTVFRTPWIYLRLLPQLIWTLVPSILLWLLQWRNGEIWKRGAALVVWITVIVGVHMVVGAFGYSKLIRYVVLVTPATIVLFGLSVEGATSFLRDKRVLLRGRIVGIAMLSRGDRTRFGDRTGRANGIRRQ